MKNMSTCTAIQFITIDIKQLYIAKHGIVVFFLSYG